MARAHPHLEGTASKPGAINLSHLRVLLGPRLYKRRRQKKGKEKVRNHEEGRNGRGSCHCRGFLWATWP